MRKLYEAADRFEAQRLIDYLNEHAIPAVMLGDYLSGAAGDLPANIFPVVWLVNNAQWLRANGLLAQFRQPASGENKHWRCACCGETVEGVFEVCWNCAKPRSEPE